MGRDQESRCCSLPGRTRCCVLLCWPGWVAQEHMEVRSELESQAVSCNLGVQQSVCSPSLPLSSCCKNGDEALLG